MDSAKPINVLVIEDSQFIFKAVKSILGKERNFTYYSHWAACLQDGLEQQINNSFDIVISSLCLPDSPNGSDTITTLCKAFINIPLIVITSSDNEQLSLQALRRGAQDYLIKENISDHRYLARSIQYAIERKRNESERRRLIKDLGEATQKLALINKRYERDLQAAEQVQRSLLPIDLDLPSTFLCKWRFDPCDELAGDLLNVIPIDQDRICFYVLDVSGHGLASALLGVQVHQALMQGNKHILFEESGVPRSCSAVLNTLNKEFQMQKPLLLYFTMFYGIVDCKAGLLHYSSAGHPAPFIHKSEGHIIIPESTGMPIGMMPDTTYEDSTVSIHSDDRLFICSDGLYECTDFNDEEFSRRRLVELIQKNHNQSLDDCLDDIMSTVHNWHGHAQQQDDCSILALEFNA